MSRLLDLIAPDPAVLVIITTNSLLLGWADSLQCFVPSVDQSNFSIYPTVEDPIFYDWLANELGDIIGVELLANAPEKISHELAGRSYMTMNVFPRIMFRSSDQVRQLGLEAFGDIEFFRAQPGLWAITVRPGDWLSTSSLLSLRTVVETNAPQ